MVPAAVHAVKDEEDIEDDHLDDQMDEGNFNEDVMDEGYQQAEQNDNKNTIKAGGSTATKMWTG